MRLDTYIYMIGFMAARADVSELEEGQIAPLIPDNGEITFRTVNNWNGKLKKTGFVYEENFAIDNKRNLYVPINIDDSCPYTWDDEINIIKWEKII